MKNNTVSVILAAYNEERYIEKCIVSLLEQTYPIEEIIVVDDGSADKTVEIIKRLIKSNSKLRLIQQDHKGAGAAWNNGVSKSKGEVIMIAGADYIYGKDYIKQVIIPINKGETFLSMHKIEKVVNWNNLWARSFGPRPCVDKNNESEIYSLIKKDKYLEYDGHDESLGYASDKGIYLKSGIKAKGIDAEIYHHNPASLKETWHQSLWIGSSLKHNPIFILSFPLLPLLSLGKSIHHLIKKDFYLTLVFFLPVFYLVKYTGFYVGRVKSLFAKEIKR